MKQALSEEGLTHLLKAFHIKKNLINALMTKLKLSVNLPAKFSG